MYDSQFSDEQMQKFNRWFQSKGIVLVCPMCNERGFAISGMVMAPIIEGKGFVSEHGARATQDSIPMLPVTCENCAHVLVFHPRYMDILE